MADETELAVAIAAISAELGTMPLEKEFRDRRLALNQKREQLERQLAQARRRSAIEAELATLQEQIAAAPEPDRRTLKRRVRELTAERDGLV